MNGNLNFAIICFGVIGLILSTISGFMELQSYNWAMTNGTIIKSEYITTRLPSQPGSTKKAFIQYIFHVDGKPYKGEKIKAGLELFDVLGIWEKDKLNLFPVGKSCAIFYSELNPNKTSLEIGVTFKTLFLMIISLLGVYVSMKFH